MFGFTVVITCLTLTLLLLSNCLAGVFPPGSREATRVAHEAVQSGVGIGSSGHLGLRLLGLGLSNLGLLGSHQL